MSAALPELPDPANRVDDDVCIYRLIPTTWCDYVNGGWQFQSGAFDNSTPDDPDESPDDMSVVLGDTLALLSRVAAALPEDTPWADDEWGVAVLSASFLRNEEAQELLRTPNDDEPAHGAARGKKNGNRRKRIKAHATWIVQPTCQPRTAR